MEKVLGFLVSSGRDVDKEDVVAAKLAGNIFGYMNKSMTSRESPKKGLFPSNKHSLYNI